MAEYRVLIADGNAQFRHSTAEYFKTDKELIRVEEAADGQAALAKLREERFDVLILELVMRSWMGWICSSSSARKRSTSRA